MSRLYVEFHEFHVAGVPDRLRTLGEPQQKDWTRLHDALDKILKDEQAQIFVAGCSEGLIGLVEVYLRQDDVENPFIVAHRYGFVQSLMVGELYRRGGTGRRLLDAAEAWARDRGATEIRLDVWEFEAGPLNFYEKSGYRTLKRSLVRQF